MNKNISHSLAVLATLACVPAAAADYYVGAAVGSRGNMHIDTGAGRLEPENRPQPFALYTGFDFTDRVAIEAGLVTFGDYRYTGARKISMGGLYLAAKGSIPISQSWTAFGKLGAARHAVRVTGEGFPVKEQNKVTPMLGLGLGYTITQSLELNLELVHYGRVKSPTSQLTFRKLQAGVSYSF
ncbi:porin family protein [Massilia sp. PAMC28688]|uniref:porin family protein n=1 Tax=Massilia sp. PAMC28688 TaxID=2861283 RepID=UPI001C635417|nr:porin family protein [Massilia sp. PAMC28688]QYF95628.1 porin family protein [Massilia sp. PAMC28688]